MAAAILRIGLPTTPKPRATATWYLADGPPHRCSARGLNPPGAPGGRVEAPGGGPFGGGARASGQALAVGKRVYDLPRVEAKGEPSPSAVPDASGGMLRVSQRRRPF